MVCAKTRYRDRITAALALSRVSAKGHARDKEARRAYRCPRCKGWHLTSRAAWR
jgi:hypothetical protein